MHGDCGMLVCRCWKVDDGDSGINGRFLLYPEPEISPAGRQQVKDKYLQAMKNVNPCIV